MSGLAPLGDRSAFLRAVRARLVDGIPANHVRPVVPDAAPAPVAYVADPREPLKVFTVAATALGATVDAVDDAPAWVAARCRERGVRRAVVSADPECAGVAEALGAARVELVAAGDIGATAACDAGVTGAAYGITLTGSLVVDCGRAGARTASLLPPVHLALLRRDALLADPGTLLRNLGVHLPGGLPSNLVLISGPSRSADIELQLTVGVHGPRELLIGLL